MTDRDRAVYRVTVFSTEYRWEGKLSVPPDRRLSDFLNNSNFTVLLLTQVIPATWDNAAWRPLEAIDSIVLLKPSLVAVIPSADAPAPPSVYPSERINQAPKRTLIHAPPLDLQGDLCLPPSVEWLDAINALRMDFVPLTHVSTWYFKTRTPLHTDLNFALVNRHWIVGLENKTGR